MRLFGRRKKTVNREREQTLREREAAEARLARDHAHVIVPLRELRAVNHISDDIGQLIRRRIRREIGES